MRAIRSKSQTPSPAKSHAAGQTPRQIPTAGRDAVEQHSMSPEKSSLSLSKAEAASPPLSLAPTAQFGQGSAEPSVALSEQPKENLTPLKRRLEAENGLWSG